MDPEYAEGSLFAPLFEDVKSTLDELFSEIAHYRNTQDYQTLLKYILRFPALALYNAFLLHIQNPGACFVANARQWRERFGRQIVPGARPMVVLIPGITQLFPRQANAVFLELPAAAMATLRECGWRFYTFIGQGGCRFMCSWDTTPEDVASPATDIEEAMRKGQL